MKKIYLKGKIGYCDNINLNINKPKGHYVYINKVHRNGTCDVNVITSLESKPLEYKNKKIRHIRYGDTYPIPIKDGNFHLWSGVNLETIKNVKISDIKSLGIKNIKIKHKNFINKNSK